MNVHDFQAKDNSGDIRDLSEFAGKALLIVNTASACGFTPQYAGLQKLYETHGDDLVVLAFPCNQFGSQEKGSDEEIRQFCDGKFKITFPLFAKVEVNGKNAHPLFHYLKKAMPGLLGSQRIKWNFTKFLIDRQGNPVKRFAPTTKPEDIESDILKVIASRVS